LSAAAGALILAAGASSRFGSMKLSAKLSNGESVYGQTLSRISAAGLPYIVITRPASLSFLLEQEQCRNVSNSSPSAIEVFTDADQGMGASLAFGIRQLPDWSACLVCLADMPFIKTHTYRLLAGRLCAANIVCPNYQDRNGNPVGFGRDFFDQLSAISGDNGAKSIISANSPSVTAVAVDDAGILNDIDTPDDLSRYQ